MCVEESKQEKRGGGLEIGRGLIKEGFISCGKNFILNNVGNHWRVWNRGMK